MEISQEHPSGIYDKLNLNRSASSANSAYSKWNAYRKEERHALWKLFLPVSPNAPILAVGLRGSDLGSLGRSCKVIHVYNCSGGDLEWAAEQAQSLRYECQLKQVASLSNGGSRYTAIVVSAKFISMCDPALALRLLEPGGTVVWVGRRSQVPSLSALIQQGYRRVRKYAIFPPGIGKILVPLGNGGATEFVNNFGTPLDRI